MRIFSLLILIILACSANAEGKKSMFPPVSDTTVRMKDGNLVRFQERIGESMYPVVMPDGLRVIYVERPSKEGFLKTYKNYVANRKGMEEAVISHKTVKPLWQKLEANQNNISRLTDYSNVTNSDQLGVYYRDLLDFELDTESFVAEATAACFDYLNAHRAELDEEHIILPEDSIVCNRFFLAKSPLKDSPFKEGFKVHFSEVADLNKQVMMDELSKDDFLTEFKKSNGKLSDANVTMIDRQFYEPAKQKVLNGIVDKFAAKQQAERLEAKRMEILKLGLSMMANGTFDGKPRPDASPDISQPLKCNPGTYQWTDEWGNRICKSFESGNTQSVEVKSGECPVGSHPSMDKWGNKTCDSFTKKETYYDTSKGCPIGMHPGMDKWGSPSCVPF